VRLAALTLAAIVAMAAAPGSAAPAPARGACRVPGSTRTIDQLWRPDMTAATAYARSRTGDIAFAVRTAHRFDGYRADHQEWSASVVKAMLLVAYLDGPSVRGRALSPDERAVLGPMIRVSNNDDAQRIFNTVGQGSLSALARRVGMTHFATNPVWGETQITARDQTRFFLAIDGFVAPRHRSYAMRLLRSVTPSQRWGIGELAPAGWRLYFKGGWGYGTGLEDHQVALLVRGCARVSIAVLTMHDGSHPYGRQTLKGIFARLLRGFPAHFSDAARGAPADARRPRGTHRIAGRPHQAQTPFHDPPIYRYRRGTG
jgi:hypothetical protein